MKYKIHDYEYLERLGEDAVGLIIHQILETKIMEEFTFGLANMDHEDRLKNQIQFGAEFNSETHFDHVMFYMVMYGATLLKYNSFSYIKDKKLFGGYKENINKVFFFSKGLEAGLINFRKKGKLSEIRSIVRQKNQEGYLYSYGDPLNIIPFPYFYYEFQSKSLEEFTIDFATDVASIRQPKLPNIPTGVFYEKAKELLPITHEILNHFFIE